MDTTFSQRFPHRHETLTANVFKLPDGRHAAEIVSTTPDTGEAVLWSQVFETDRVTTITGRLVNNWDRLVADRKPR
jgi:hypothetical protein